jgi:dihydrodipicolinate synthase/N-acetylneuraminate lyase
MSNKKLEQAKARLRGPVVPMTTSIKADGAVDYEGLSKLTRFYIEGGKAA